LYIHLYIYIYIYICIYIHKAEGVETTDSVMINGEVESETVMDIQVVEIKDITEAEEVEDFVSEKGITYKYVYTYMCIYIFVYIYMYIYT
jgi:hypothetical protein